MDIGRCLLDSGDECTGAAGEAYHFDALSGGDSMALVVGFQGSQMLDFVFRADGIDPGTLGMSGSDSPTVDLYLLNASSGAQIVYFHQPRTGFRADGSSFVSDELLVIVGGEQRTALAGNNVTALGFLTDRNGAERCGRVNVVPRL